MIDKTIADTKRRMEKSIATLAVELTKIRTGRANPALLDHISVEYYGSPTPLKNTASIVVQDTRTLTITAYEKTMIPVIEKAILSSDLGITPNTAGNVIRIVIPPLTQERRLELVKTVRLKAEKGKIAIRNIRRDANSDLKGLVKEKAISGDEERRAGEQIQKITDGFSAKVDTLVEVKEKELLQV